MGLYVYWDEQQQHTIRVDVVGTWGWSDFHTHVGLFTENMTHAIARACIIDLRHTQLLPAPNALHHLRQIFDETPVLMIIFVGAKDALIDMLTVLQRAIPDATHTLRVVSTLDEAYQLINDISESGA